MNFGRKKREYNPDWAGRRLLDYIADVGLPLVLIPLAPALLELVLFYFTSDVAELGKMLIAAPIILALWYFGVFFVIIFQSKNDEVNQTVLDAVIILALTVFSIATIVLLIAGFFKISSYMGLGAGLSALTVSAICLALGKRE
ncbi:MAG: hypothetical protein E7617_04240 [Ruminococcaceae bacterium]|nr:hypothetical protein [Oscillospiraceae bacterium]